MAQENTAINQLIHLVNAPKIERESAEDLFWARNQVNARGQRALDVPAPTPLVHAHAPSPVMTMPMGSMAMNDVAPLASGSAPLALPTLPQYGGGHAPQPHAPHAMQPQLAQHAPHAMQPQLAQHAPHAMQPQLAQHAPPVMTAPMPAPAAVPRMTMLPTTPTPESMDSPWQTASVVSRTSEYSSNGRRPPTNGTEPATPGARHAARVAATRANVAKGGPAARAAAARAAAARAAASAALDAQGRSSTLKGIPSDAARAMVAQVVAGTPPNGSTTRGVMPVFHDPEEDEATVRVDNWIAPDAHLAQIAQQHMAPPHAAQIAQQQHMTPPLVAPMTPVPMAPLPMTPVPMAQQHMTPPLVAPMTPVPMAPLPMTPVYGAPLPLTSMPMGHAMPFAYATPQEPTVRVRPLAMSELEDREQRSFAREFLGAVRRFAAPLGVLVVVAVFAGGYFAFDGQGGKPRVAAAATKVEAAPAAVEVAAVVEAPPVKAVEPPTITEPTITPTANTPTVTPLPAETSVAAVMADKLATARAEETVALSKGAVVVDEPEIEMDAVHVDDAKRTSSRSKSRSKRVAASKRGTSKLESQLDSQIDAIAGKRETRREKLAREKAEKAAAKAERVAAVKAAKAEKEDKLVAELPANVANKTDSAMGKVSITSNVPAMIYVDGRSTKMMTPQKIAVPAGKHKITLLEPESKKAKTHDIEVVAGKSTAVDKQF